MRVYYSIEDFKKLENAVVTTGTFDGVHIGHKVVIQSLVDAARKINGESVLITFNPHPRIVLNPSSNLQLLTDIDDRIHLLKKTGIDHLLIIPFDKEFARKSSLEFVRDILVNQIGTKKLIIGYDHHFGRNREGSFEHLVEYGPVYGFEVEKIKEQDVDQQKISSTQIRKALENGACDVAQQLLGYPYFLKGTVVEGNQIGRTIGFPTANISMESPLKLIPKQGVYLAKFYRLLNDVTKEYFGMLNIGTKPTFGKNDVSIEIHLFNFNEDVYGEKVKVEILHWIRAEKKFSNKSDLEAQIKQDKNKCEALLLKYS